MTDSREIKALLNQAYWAVNRVAALIESNGEVPRCIVVVIDKIDDAREIYDRQIRQDEEANRCTP